MAEPSAPSTPDPRPRDLSETETVHQPPQRAEKRAADATLVPGQSVLASLSQQSRVAFVQLRDEPSVAPAPMLKPLTPKQHGVQEQAGKYRVRGELARGGVGVVFKGHDIDLGRDVALKFLQEGFGNDPSFVQRFIEEAQIGAQLQHPGIVPVYDLSIAAGRPFFTMKLIRGRTLSALLAERLDPSQDRRRYLAIFESVCQTMAYAHARGVVHRDLKPANVMIGSFGEVNIVDWGMGKVMRAGGAADEERAAQKTPMSLVETVRHKYGSQSIAGSIMGTPAYMPPEQARGDIDGMDERSDVFSLGAMLCEILTGQPAYVGDFHELMAAARDGQLADARQRLAKCGADEVIVHLALDCLAPAINARPRHAGEVADRMSKYLADAEQRVRDAEVRARAAKRTQKLVIGVGIAIAAALVISVMSWRSARRALDEYDLLANGVRLREAMDAQNRLHPAWPENAAALGRWLDEQAKPLVAELPHLEATLSELRASAASSGPAGFVFADKATQFKHDNLARLVLDLQAFADPQTGLLQEVAQRRAWASAVEELTITRYRASWQEAREALRRADDVVASRAYAERPIDLAPQMGLVPIGMNPRTKLWEFYDLRSAWDPASRVAPAELRIPSLRPDGSLEVTDDTGLVFILVPGGSFAMGAQHADANGANFDPEAEVSEGPVQEVVLGAYFLSRYELTQAQWQRLCGGDEPSLSRAGRPSGDRYITGANPVEGVNWLRATEVLGSLGWQLPTEAQWERACRAGTITVWSTGNAASSLQGFANLSDAAALRANMSWPVEAGVDDGYLAHAPVGAFRPNAFGFHDMHGNVFEWCLDPAGGYVGRPPRAGDGYRDAPDRGSRVSRGGSFAFPAVSARSAYRYFESAESSDGNLGVRPARAVMPAR
jgi:serine/threonine-protein kinase